MKNKTVKDFYLQDIAENKVKLAYLKNKIRLISITRLGIFLGGVACAWIFRTNYYLLSGILLLTIISFLFFVVLHNKLFLKRDYEEKKIVFDENELKALERDFSSFDGAPERVSSSHPYSLDLDIFGNNSLFQSINRTCTFQGREILANWFEHPLHEKTNILLRQKAIEELAKKPSLSRHFIVTGSLQPIEKSDKEEIADFVHYQPQFFNNKFWKLLIYLFPIAWLVFLIFVALGVIPSSFVGLAIGIGLLTGESCFKKINKLEKLVGKKEKIFSNYSRLITIIEQEKYDSPLLLELQESFLSRDTTVSSKIKKLSRMIGNLDVRYNIIGRLVMNSVFLWDIRTAVKIEQWHQENKEFLVKWIDETCRQDALFSLGLFAFNHPSYIFPEVADEYFSMKGINVGHPLMDPAQCVRNDIEFPYDPWFLVITGANMAGKSTYLRTMGISFMLASVGMPVYADSFCFYPARLVTSLRTSDSLTHNESYFFAELKRLKMIIDELHQGKKLFIILDEILKGTNSVDKQKGSLALVKQFISLKSCGIIATHDLLLGNLEKEFPDNIRNFRFEADITGDELTFTYKLRPGVAENMNACFLMKKMGITI